MSRCFGLARNLHWCHRTGSWRWFCPEHKKQPIVWLFVAVFTVGAGTLQYFSFWTSSVTSPRTEPDSLSLKSLEIRIMRLNAYDDYWANPRTGGFAPWMGMQLELNNRGKRRITIRTFQVMSTYKPLNRQIISHEWYVSGTRVPGSELPFGEQELFSIDAGEVLSIHINVSLDIGGRGLSPTEKEAYFSALDETSALFTLFGDFYVFAKDAEGQTFKSHEFFAQGPEIMLSFSRKPTKSPGDPRSKTSTTFVAKDRVDLDSTTNRDVIRDAEP
jgi:hypothetical protein